MALDDERSIFVVESEGGIRVSDIRKFLAEIEDAYNRVLLLLTLLDDLPRLERSKGSSPFRPPLSDYGPLAIATGGERKLVHFTKSSVASMVGRRQSLILKSVRLESPGSWKLIGVSDSLEVLRKYLNDRNERKKDKQYRDVTDEEKRRLENGLLRTKVLGERVKVAKELGATEQDLAPLLDQLLYDPLDELAVFQDRGLITDVRIVGPDEPEMDVPPERDAPPMLDLNSMRKIRPEE
jgi:hypothetical protein